jgi:hypothetical protein
MNRPMVDQFPHHIRQAEVDLQMARASISRALDEAKPLGLKPTLEFLRDQIATTEKTLTRIRRDNQTEEPIPPSAPPGSSER